MATVGKLDSYFMSIINDLMILERQPLARLQTQRDSVRLKTNIFTDVETKLDDLQDAVRLLKSSSPSRALVAGRSSSITGVESGFNVLTASAGSSAMLGTYQITEISLAREHRVRSDQQTYADQGLGLAGTLLIGGAASRSQTLQTGISNTVTGSDVAAPASGQEELGRGSYFIETRNDATLGWQFRLVDTDGNAIRIRQGATDSYTDAWQAIPAGGGVYNTGRGLSITFGAEDSQYLAASRASDNAAQVDYTAQGASISVAATDSLNAIASKINAATCAEKNGVVASVVDKQLILASESSGTAYTIQASDASGSVLQSLGVLTGPNTFENVMQPAANASFKVNGLAVTRSQNTGLSDVISGVTLNLAPDAQGKSASLAVTTSWAGARSAIDDFIAKFNAVTAYLAEKTSVTSTGGGATGTYTRGALADESVFSDLRSSLFDKFMSNHSTGRAYTGLREIGLTLDDNLSASASDSTKLENALNTNLADVEALMDQVMGAMDSILGRFTGDSGQDGYLDSAKDSYSSQLTEIDGQISDMNVRLAEREQYLTEQYAQLQATLVSLTYSQQMWASINKGY
jgi:flagellar hook-associated protein 2